MSSVKSYLRRQADVNNFRANHISNSPEVERPLSEYDNLTISTLQAQSPLADIKFRFDDINNSTMSSSQQNSNNNNNTIATTIPSHMPKYENVIDTIQIRNNKRESDQQVKMDHNDSDNCATNRPVISMSEAKSSFFGLNHASTQPSPSSQEKHTVISDDDLDQLIEDCANIKIVSSIEIQQYVNLINNEDVKESPTSSNTGSSASTFSPSTTPTRDERKNSEAGSNRSSKSPKFTIPSPSQAVYMSTTVPQNIKGGSNIIGGRHRPTRASLRHSKLIVKNFQAHSHGNSLNIKHVWLAKFVLTLMVFVGICLLALSAWISLFALSTPISQNPFWSAGILIISGLMGFYLLSFKRSRSKFKINFFWFLKLNASVIIILSVFLTTLALIYAAFHYFSISYKNKTCFPENVFVNSSSCICVFNSSKDLILSRELTRDDSDGRMNSSGHIDIQEGENVVHFRDLSCYELGTWSHILLTSMILNFIGLLLCVCYLTQFIFGCKRRKKRQYMSVHNGA